MEEGRRCKCGTMMKKKSIGILKDSKTWGSWKVAKVLGLKAVKVPDPSGAIYQRSGSGYRAGDPKMITIFQYDPEFQDTFESDMQLNHYRLLLEDAGYPVDKMMLEIIVRDGSTYIATNRGITEEMYYIPVRIIYDDEVRSYFDRKRRDLLGHLQSGVMPDPCKPWETWNGIRCERYCPVWESCDIGIEAHREEKT
ncbi:hypothetical protein HYZ97_02415 [Candidatus Pacearchaeota archaeon]|nr:hypothetical protein [Candidatus Pacearchaeota archaeon]